MLADGGNAADAACAMGFALQVLEPHMNGPAGEVPILVREAASDRVHAISGQGSAPARATIEHFRGLGLDRIPGDGLTARHRARRAGRLVHAAGSASAPAAWRRSSPRRAASPSADFRWTPFLRGLLKGVERRFREEWPGSAAVYLPVRAVGERQTNPAYAEVLAQLARAEADVGGSRETGIRAARDWFYEGPPAERIEAFVCQPVRDASGREHPGLLQAQDLAAFTGGVEEPVSIDYRGAQVWKCGPWTQGPVFLQQLRLAEGFDLAGMGELSTDALHTWIEIAKLAFADREACYGDPRFADVPLDELLSRTYAESRRELIDPRAGLARDPAWTRTPPRRLAVAGAGQPRQPRTAGAGRARPRRHHPSSTRPTATETWSAPRPAGAGSRPLP